MSNELFYICAPLLKKKSQPPLSHHPSAKRQKSKLNLFPVPVWFQSLACPSCAHLLRLVSRDMMAWLVPDDGGASERNTSPGATPSSTTTPPSALLSLSSGPLSSRSSSSVRNDSTAAIKGTLSGAQTAIPVDENSTDAPPETPPIVIAAATPAGTNDTASTSEGVVAADATTPSTPPSTRSEPTVHLVDSPPPASPQHTTPVIAPLLIDDTTTTAETVGNDEATASTPPPQSLALAVLSDQDNAPASSVEPIPVETPSPCRRSSRARHAPDHFLVAENLHPFLVNKKKLKGASEEVARSSPHHSHSLSHTH